MRQADSPTPMSYASPMPPTGGLGVFGALIMPLAILTLLLRDKGPVGKFLKAGATSPETARKPRSLEITNPDLYSGAIRRGILIATDDGRYWVNIAALQRSRRRIIIVAATLFIMLGAVAMFVIIRS